MIRWYIKIRKFQIWAAHKPFEVLVKVIQVLEIVLKKRCLTHHRRMIQDWNVSKSYCTKCYLPLVIQEHFLWQTDTSGPADCQAQTQRLDPDTNVFHVWIDFLCRLCTLSLFLSWWNHFAFHNLVLLMHTMVFFSDNSFHLYTWNYPKYCPHGEFDFLQS